MRGRVILAAGERQVELRFTTNRLCWMEEVAGKPVAEIAKAFGTTKFRFADLRIMVAAGAGIEDVQVAGDIIDDAGMEATMAALEQALTSAFPKVEAAGKKTAAA